MFDGTLNNLAKVFDTLLELCQPFFHLGAVTPVSLLSLLTEFLEKLLLKCSKTKILTTSRTIFWSQFFHNWSSFLYSYKPSISLT